MDFYQGVVIEYIRADRAIFVNTEFCLQINAADNPDQSGPHWYVDAVATDFRNKSIFLCEISFAVNLDSLIKRLQGWHAHWQAIRNALARDAHLPPDWPVRPWLFVPEELVPVLVKKLTPLLNGSNHSLPIPLITTLEMTQPWRYRSWSRNGEATKPDIIPAQMQS